MVKVRRIAPYERRKLHRMKRLRCNHVNAVHAQIILLSSGGFRQEETLHIVMDNFSPHLKAEVWSWANRHRVKFYLTPTNASWLNRIECQFTALKKFALENSDYRSHEERQAAIKSYLKWRNRQRRIAVEPWRSRVQKRKTRSNSDTKTAA